MHEEKNIQNESDYYTTRINNLKKELSMATKEYETFLAKKSSPAKIKIIGKKFTTQNSTPGCKMYEFKKRYTGRPEGLYTAYQELEPEEFDGYMQRCHNLKKLNLLVKNKELVTLINEFDGKYKNPRTLPHTQGEQTGIIYLLIYKGGPIYIGSSSTLLINRFIGHVNRGIYTLNGKAKVTQDINKKIDEIGQEKFYIYGIDTFKYDTLNDLRIMEQYYITKFNALNGGLNTSNPLHYKYYTMLNGSTDIERYYEVIKMRKDEKAEN
jgi:hypothetical protein